jgi:hypothetical protein
MASAGSVVEVVTTSPGDGASPAAPRKRVLLISNRVMHYRVSVYNYFWRHFQEQGWEFAVLANEMQRTNQNQCEFEFIERPFSFSTYKAEIKRFKPDVVILFLHMKDRILWPLIHWLKVSGIPIALWTKARNLDDVDNRIRNAFFDYLHFISNGLILYTESLKRFIPERQQRKIFIANNTINFEEFPPIPESKEQIKRDLGIPFEKVVFLRDGLGKNETARRSTILSICFEISIALTQLWSLLVPGSATSCARG